MNDNDIILYGMVWYDMIYTSMCTLYTPLAIYCLIKSFQGTVKHSPYNSIPH